MILLTGPMRSGTSIVSKLIASYKGVNFFYEPQTFIKILKKKDYELADNYSLFSLLIPAMSGRFINFNKNDSTYIFNYKMKSEIMKKISKSWSETSIFKEQKNQILMIKYPSFVDEISNYKSNIFNQTKIFTFRKPAEVLKSLMRKRYSSISYFNRLLPGDYEKFENQKIPLFIKKKNYLKYLEADEQGRSLIYYNQVMSSKLKNFDFIFNYENLFSKKIKFLKKFLKKKKFTKTLKTQFITNSFKNKKTKRFEININKNNKFFFKQSEQLYAKLLDYERIQNQKYI